MIEFGHYSLILSLGTSIILMFLSFFGAYSRDFRAVELGVRAGKVTFFLVSISFLILILGFLDNNFTVKYIVENSNAYLPWYYKVSATWAGHEGSLLLWAWILSFWIYLVAVIATDLPPSFRAKVFGVLGVISSGFLSFVILTSNPFDRILPSLPLVGKDLNPLLQDFGLILHPPLLYMGYVGFAISFAFIVAALLEGRLDTVWARWCRPWVISAWAFLTLGIALGSWWAYYELGWGGWWFWDPVENASFMPWIAGTALIHSLAATEKRDVFKVWTAFLAITTFSLSLIGTFLVRSGVLTSVHAFASDPTRGIYILMLIALISGGAFLILLLNVSKLKSTGKYKLISKEVSILANNIILSLACAIVFIGTLSPLLFDVLNLSKISVGPPYFNVLMLPVLVIIVLFLSVAPYLNWKKDKLIGFRKPIIISFLLAIFISYLLNYGYEKFSILAFIMLVLIITSTIMAIIDAYYNSSKAGKFSLPSKSYLAMSIGHFGFLVCCVGIIMTSIYSIEVDKYVKPGAVTKLRDISFEMKGVSEKTTKLYEAIKIDFLVKDENGKLIRKMSPEKRNYKITKMPMAESDLIPGLKRDIYIALGEPQGDDGAWSVRFQIKPYIRWVWLGGLIMAFSAVFSVADRRYSMRKNR